MWTRVAEEGDDYVRENVWHRIEFQTLRRLPETNFIFFTVRTLVDPINTVEKYPGAAGALAAHIRRKNKLTGVEMPESPGSGAVALLGYLDRVSVAAGLRPGVVPGVQG
jgi:hypothetical protein